LSGIHKLGQTLISLNWWYLHVVKDLGMQWSQSGGCRMLAKHIQVDVIEQNLLSVCMDLGMH